MNPKYSIVTSLSLSAYTDPPPCFPLAPPIPDPPTSVVVTSITTTTITISWVAPTPSLGNQITSYTLVLTGAGGTVITRSVSGTSLTFTGLQEYRVYSCVVTAVSLYGPVSASTTAVTATTLEAGNLLILCACYPYYYNSSHSLDMQTSPPSAIRGMGVSPPPAFLA